MAVVYGGLERSVGETRVGEGRAIGAKGNLLKNVSSGVNEGCSVLIKTVRRR